MVDGLLQTVDCLEPPVRYPERRNGRGGAGEGIFWGLSKRNDQIAKWPNSEGRVRGVGVLWGSWVRERGRGGRGVVRVVGWGEGWGRGGVASLWIWPFGNLAIWSPALSPPPAAPSAFIACAMNIPPPQGRIEKPPAEPGVGNTHNRIAPSLTGKSRGPDTPCRCSRARRCTRPSACRSCTSAALRWCGGRPRPCGG